VRFFARRCRQVAAARSSIISSVPTTNLTTSWIPTAAGSDFDIDNLPLGIFSPRSEAPRPGVAIGAFIADLSALFEAELIDEASLNGARVLNGFLGRGRAHWSALRTRLQYLFGQRATSQERVLVESSLVPSADATMHLPIDVGDYVDFYSSIEHATNVGKLFRPADPLGANYRYVPIGYHGRSSTIVLDRTLIPRPVGQRLSAGAAVPTFGPSERLDFELELGFVAGLGNTHGSPIPIDAIRDYAYGYVLLNDWSARDIQAWESLPLGPLLGKSFATSISAWVVSLDALAPFRVENRELDPEPLPHLRTDERWAYDIELEVLLESHAMRTRRLAPARIAATNFRHMYWNLAQQLAHLTSNGSRVRPGDLFGSGTVSGAEPGSSGCLLEMTQGGLVPFSLPSGESRTFLQDGDTVIMRGRAVAGERRVGFGEVRGTIVG
jgi:fumarylacetoacetase